MEETYPSLYSGVLVREETEIEMAGALPVKSEAVSTFGWVGSDEVLQE